MLPLLKRLFAPSGKPVPRSQRRRVRLHLEALEDRSVPAVYQWVGPNLGLWSNPANWVDALGQAHTAPPGAADSLFLTAPLTSIADIGGAVSDLVISSGNVSLQQSLRVNAYFAMGGWQVVGASGNQTEVLEIAGNGTWTTGSFASLQVNSGPLSITGPDEKRLENSFLTFLGGTSVWSAGDIALTGVVATSYISVAQGTFDIVGPGRITGNLTDPNDPQFMNSATLRKISGGTTTFDITFANSGMFRLDQTIAFEKSARQTGGTTLLNPGSIETTSTYFVLGGFLEGTGVVRGNLSNGGVISPHLTNEGGQVVPGTITVFGNFTQTSGGRMLIDIAADGDSDKLDVKFGQHGGGHATLGGIMQIRNSAYTQDANSSSVIHIVLYATVSGSFDQVQFDVPVWVGPDGRRYRFVYFVGANTFHLIVVDAEE